MSDIIKLEPTDMNHVNRRIFNRGDVRGEVVKMVDKKPCADCPKKKDKKK